jgi:hypothetical protein
MLALGKFILVNDLAQRKGELIELLGEIARDNRAGISRDQGMVLAALRVLVLSCREDCG